MLANRSMPRSTVIPELAYDDVGQAITWLCDTFGFRERWRAGSHRAQLSVGDGAIVAMERGVDRPGARAAVMVRVEDVDTHHERAEGRGARILQGPTDYPYGERQYTVEDLGGHHWTFSQSIADVAPERWGGTSKELDAPQSVRPVSPGGHVVGGGAVAGIQPELWIDSPREAVAFYEVGFGATVLHQVGDGDDIVAQLAVGDAAFWVAGTSTTMKRLSPRAIDGATSRTLLVVEGPGTFVRQAVAAGAKESSPVSHEHGWRLGRIIDPFGHEWEIGTPLGTWPPRT